MKNTNCAWKFLNKYTWKAASMREKNEKIAKKTFHAHFLFSRRKKKTLLAIVARYFRFDLVIWDLSIFGPVACHLRFDFAVPAQTAYHYCLNKRIFVTEALIFTWFYEFWTSSLSVSLRPYDFSASSSSSFFFRSFDFCARSLLFSLIPWHFCTSSLLFSFSPN